MTLRYRIIEESDQDTSWRIVTIGYFYTIRNRNLQEIIAFHWHPDQRSDVIHPHLHLGAGAQIGYDRLHRAHIPTGRITIQDVLRFAITDLGVEPLIDRETALRMLDETKLAP